MENDVSFIIDGQLFEYDEEKNLKNIEKHGLSFMTAARVFFDYDRLEFYDEAHSLEEDRYKTIGCLGNESGKEIVFVVYTERLRAKDDKEADAIRLISARMANSFERGLYYGKRY